jgi:hypothetical protein
MTLPRLAGEIALTFATSFRLAVIADLFLSMEIAATMSTICE